jgi:hypothetical protein
MTTSTDPRFFVLLPPQGHLGVEAECYDRLHQAYSAWMVQTRTYTPASVAVLVALSARTWAAYCHDEGRA